MGNLSYDDAQAVKQSIRALAAQDDPIKAFHDIIDVWDANPGLYEAVHQPDPLTGVTIQNPGPDAARMADKYARKTGAAAQDWVAGMQNPKADFKQAAIAAGGKWASRTQEAIQQDKFRKGMANVDAAEAIATAVSDGGSAYTAGVQKRLPKVQRAFARLAPLLGGVSQTVRAMPQDTDAQREQRLLAARRAMIEVGKRYRGG
jgi:lipoprotein-anchoring transpeptidase ErfK/SrfK